MVKPLLKIFCCAYNPSGTCFCNCRLPTESFILSNLEENVERLGNFGSNQMKEQILLESLAVLSFDNSA